MSFVDQGLYKVAYEVALKPTDASKGAVEEPSKQVKQPRSVIKRCLAVLVAPLVIAAFGYASFRVYRTLDQGVVNNCYGRYEMCMELTYKGNLDHLPGPNDSFFFEREDVTRSSQQIIDATVDSWYSECVNKEQTPYVYDPDTAPWYCQCNAELYFCSYLITARDATHAVVGEHWREQVLKVSEPFRFISLYSWFAAAAVLVFSILVSLLRLVPWGKIFQKSTALATPGQEADNFNIA